jgi:asparagine N-glycosylation enzyme membrane subunit Stt3
MSGKERGMSRKSNLLDKLFGNKRRTILGALVTAVIGYLLFLLFGDIHATEDALYRPVVMGVLAFVALFLV